MSVFSFERVENENRLRVKYGSIVFNLWYTKVYPSGTYHIEKSRELYLEPALYRQLVNEAKIFLLSV